MKSSVDRRSFLRRAAGGAMLPAAASGLVAACTEEDADGALTPRMSKVGNAVLGHGGYGPLANDQGAVLLPRGFQARTLGAVGDRMSDGNPTPIALDGMGAFDAGQGRVRLVRNHEDRNGPSVAIGANAYDPLAGGGTTTVEVDAARRLVRDFISLSGTAVNCAGGPTPWASWLSCEETVAGPREGQGGPGDQGLLRLIFESPGADVLDNPDNITVSPRGGLVLCEDGSGAQYLRGLTPNGDIFDFAVNQVNDAEFAGACFSPDGKTLFVNIQGDTVGRSTDPAVRGGGMTLAIWGPWEAGAL